MKKFKYLILLNLIWLLGGCASLQPKPPILPDQVVEMAKAGTPAEAIIQKLKESGTVYQLSAAELVKLSKAGVPTSVLDYMQSTYLEAVRRDEAQRAFFYYPPYPPPYWYGRRYYRPWW
ncbi:MAG TPA: hypothetical protein VM532_10615 [Burkholderiales bacterium]|nr:hypothetical protein [Burkholderiales bacterium]